MPESVRRFDAMRGRQTLPAIDLSLQPVIEPTWMEGMAPGLQARTSLGVAERFSNNIFLLSAADPGPKKPEDWLTVITPSVVLGLPSTTMPIKFEYFVDIIRAGNYEAFDTEEHHLSLTTNLRIGHGWTLKVTDIFARPSVEPRFPAFMPFYPADGVDNYIENILDVALEYKFGDKARAVAGYEHDFVRFDAPWNRMSGYAVHRISGRGYYKVMPKTSFMAEYVYSIVDNRRPGTDNLRTDLGAGLEWDITSKLTGGFVLGYEWVDWSRSFTEGGMYAHAELAYAYSEKLAFGLYLDRHLIETSAEANNAIFGNSFFSTQTSLNALYRITEKVSAKGEMFWIKDDYRVPPFGSLVTVPNNVDTTGFSFGLEWRPRPFLRFGAEYLYQRAAARISLSNFEESGFLINASMGF